MWCSKISHYTIFNFVEKIKRINGTALIIMSNSDNAESIFNELIEYTTGNNYTPGFW